MCIYDSLCNWKEGHFLQEIYAYVNILLTQKDEIPVVLYVLSSVRSIVYYAPLTLTLKQDSYYIELYNHSIFWLIHKVYEYINIMKESLGLRSEIRGAALELCRTIIF